MEETGMPPEQITKEQQEINAIQERIETAKNAAAEAAERLKQELNRIKDSADKAQRVIDMKIKDKAEGIDSDALIRPIPGEVGKDDTPKHHTAVTEIVIKEILQAYKSNPELIPKNLSTPSRQIVDRILSKVDINSIDQQSAPYVYKIIYKALNNQIAGSPLKALTDQEMFSLSHVNPDLGEKVVESLVEAARNSGTPENEIKQFENKFKRKDMVSSTREHEFLEFWRSYGSQYYEEVDKEKVRRFFIPEEFVDYAEKLKKEVKEKLGPTSSDKDVMREVSGRLKDEMVLLVGALARALDNATPKQMYDEIVKKDFYRGVETTYVNLSRAISKLQLYFENNEKDYKQYTFYQNGSLLLEGEQKFIYKDKDGQLKEEKKPAFRVDPSSVAEKPVSIAQFIHYISIMADHELRSREYTHNVNYIFTQPAPKPDQGGFYQQLKGYSEKMTGTDIDEIYMLPDSDIIIAAHNLYAKYIEEEFGKASWIHHPTLFSPQENDVRTKVQNEVLEQLKRQFPEAIGKEAWRLRRALSMAVGMSRGVIFNEPETASWADPALNPDGSATFYSYYVSDPHPLTPLNPAHWYLRWQTQDAMHGPLLFIPVEGLEQDFSHWDHKNLWERMKQFQQSFVQGRKVFTRENEVLLIDYLTNIGGVGNLITRGGWRTPALYDGWLKLVDGNMQKEDILLNWKRVENIGYEVLLDFINKRIKDGFLSPELEIITKVDEEIREGKIHLSREITRDKIIAERLRDNQSSISNNVGIRDDFFKYLFKNYIRSGLTEVQIDTEFVNYKRDLEAKARKDIRDKINKGELALDKSEEESAVQLEVHKRMLFRTLSGVIANRFPSKFVNIERDRSVDDGTRAWKKIRIDLGWEGESGIARMDKTMKNLALIESLLRRETSEKMQSALNNNQTLDQVETNYRLTKTKMRDLLNRYVTGPENKLSEQELNDLDSLISKIEQKHSRNDDYLDNFANKIRNNPQKKYFPFAIGLDELDSRFLKYRSLGPRALARALDDISGAELQISEVIKEYIKALDVVAIDGKRDISHLVKGLKQIREQIGVTIGLDLAYKVTHHLAMMTIAYFRKDTMAQGPFGTLLHLNEPHSLAAEFASGRSTAVWEWTVKDIDNFIIALETGPNAILPKKPINLAWTDEKARKEGKFKKKYIGQIKLFGKTLFKGFPREVREDYEYTSANLRKDAGAEIKHVAIETLTKYTPIFFVILIIFALKKALDELKEK